MGNSKKFVDDLYDLKKEFDSLMVRLGKTLRENQVGDDVYIYFYDPLRKFSSGLCVNSTIKRME